MRSRPARVAPWALLVALLSLVPASAQRLEEKVVEHTLKNGMKFLFVERHDAPVFTGRIVFRVGGVDEPAGATGLAHMFEHMAFKGTRTIGTRSYVKEQPILEALDRTAKAMIAERARGPRADSKRIAALQAKMRTLQEQQRKYIVPEEFSEIYTKNGGADLNAETGNDETSYYVSLPANRLELWALMESQRMAQPVLREFYEERDVVAEERRRSYDDDPDGRLYEQLLGTAFLAHPYQHSPIGWMSDVQSLTADRARAFHKTYYVPNNAVAAVVGDIKTADAIRLMERYFGPLPAAPAPPPVLTVEPAQGGERRVNVLFDAEPRLEIAYHKPSAPHTDDFVFDVIDSVMSSGRTSRLYTALVKEKRLAADVGTFGAPGNRYPNLWIIDATPLAPHTAAEVEQAIYAEVERLQAEPVTPQELAKVKNQIDADYVRGLASNSGLAAQLTYLQAVIGDWRYLTRRREVIARVTPADVQRVARQYLVPANRTVATVVKEAR